MYISCIETIMEQNQKVYIGDGEFEDFRAEINSKNSIEEITEFETELNIKLPDDYKTFLSECDGINFYVAGELSLYGIQEIIELKECIDYLDGIIPIGYCLEEYIVINCNEISSGKYMYAGDAYCPDEYYSLDCNFYEFFERHIMSNFNNYWTWVKPDKRYRFIE